MPPAKCDVIPKEQVTPFAEKRACTGCRKIKSRCIIPEDASICTRCARLHLECTIPTHHRGVKIEGTPVKAEGYYSKTDGIQHSPAMNPAHVSSSASATVSAPASGPPSASASSSRLRQSSGGGRSSSSGSSRSYSALAHSARQASPDNETPPPTTSTNPFSVQSLLDTTSSETTASKALLSSTVHSHLQQMPSVKVSPRSACQPLIQHIVAARLFDESEVVRLVQFYYNKLNPIIALLDPHLYTCHALRTNPDYRLLLAAICTVAAKFIMPHRYLECLDFLKPALARIAAEDVAPQLEMIQTLSILAMWKHPKDGSSWRKVRLAITQSFELGLHELFGSQQRPQHPLSREFIQSQRTFLQLACFEDGYRDQRHLPPAIDPALLPDPREWIDSLGDMVQDIDVRLAASRENAMIKRNLISELKKSNAESPDPSQPSRATCLRNARLIKMTITAETTAMQVWMNPPESEIPCQHSGRPCLLFHTTNTLFNYHRALYSIYSSPFLSTPSFCKDRQTAFQRCSELSVELFELLNGPYGQESYYRYVHDIVILNLAVAAVWICDNWRAMPNALAVQAATAIRKAAEATAPSMEFHLEQGSYLARFLRFCCTKLPSTLSINENSPVGMEELVMSEDARWAMGISNGAGRGAGPGKRKAEPPLSYGTAAASTGAMGLGASVGVSPSPPPSLYGGKRRRVESEVPPHRTTSEASADTSSMYHEGFDAAPHHQPHPHPHSHPHPHAHMYGYGNGSWNGNGNGNGYSHGYSHGHSHGHSVAGHATPNPRSMIIPAHSSHPQPLSTPLANSATAQADALPPLSPPPNASLTHASAINFVSDSLNPPTYPVHWDTYDDNSIITFLQNIGSGAI
ncbi:hypothetical protein ACQY0O_004454 [Thecaphora frezii]